MEPSAPSCTPHDLQTNTQGAGLEVFWKTDDLPPSTPSSQPRRGYFWLSLIHTAQGVEYDKYERSEDGLVLLHSCGARFTLFLILPAIHYLSEIPPSHILLLTFCVFETTDLLSLHSTGSVSASLRRCTHGPTPL